MLKNLLSDFTNNAWWELIAVIMLTVIARIFRLTFGRKMTRRHEIIFWAGCIVCGTVALAVANVGVIRPILGQFQNRKIASPNLHCSLIQGAVLSEFDATPVSVLYQLKVVNSGSPSVAWRWRLEITLTTGQVIEFDADEKPNTETLVNPATRAQFAKFDNGNYLPNSLLESPLQTGAGKIGWIVFKVNTAKQYDLERIGNRFVLKFEDCEGNATSITNVITQKGGIFR